MAQNVVPIDALSPFAGQGPRMAIRGRCLQRSDIKTFEKKDGGGQGRLASCVMTDESNSIKVTFFNEAVDSLFHNMNEGAVYILSGFSVKNADKRYNRTGCSYELTVDASTGVIQPARDDTSIPQERFNFSAIAALPNKTKGSYVDILGAVLKKGEIENIQRKADGSNLSKCVMIVGEPWFSVEVTLWGEKANLITELQLGSVVGITGCRIGDWMGTSLSTSSNSKILVNPKVAELASYQSWYNTEYQRQMDRVNCISQKQDRTQMMMTQQDTKNSNNNYLGRHFLNILADEEKFKRGDGKVDFIDVVASVSKFQQRVGPKDNQEPNLFSYISCPTCMKKLSSPDGIGKMKCSKCQQEFTYEQAQIRYLFTAEINDRIDTKWVTFYDEGGKKLFGKEARTIRDQVNALNGETLATTKFLAEYLNHIPYLMRLRVKEENYTPQDGQPTDVVRVSVSDMEPLFRRSNTAEPILVDDAAGAAGAARMSQGARNGAQAPFPGPFQTKAMLDEMETMAKIINTMCDQESKATYQYQ